MSIDKLKFMLSMAAADGSITKEELRLFSHRALEWGVNDDQFEAMLDQAAADDAPLPDIPQDREQAHELLKQLVYMMAADGKLDEQERQLFAVIAAQMKVNESELNGIIDKAIEDHSS